MRACEMRGGTRTRPLSPAKGSRVLFPQGQQDGGYREGQGLSRTTKSSIRENMRLCITNIMRREREREDPVKATPTMSLPERATGRPWTWMGVGLLMPMDCKYRRSAGGRPRSLNFFTGCGNGAWPVIIMWYLLRMALAVSMLMSRTLAETGSQPRSRLVVYLFTCNNVNENDGEGGREGGLIQKEKGRRLY